MRPALKGNTMSVLAQKHIVHWTAPLSISDAKVTVCGSWSDAAVHSPMDPGYLLHMRLHVWKQQYQGKVSNMCLDWVVAHDSGTLRHAAVLHADNAAFVGCLQDETFDAHLQDILDRNHTIAPIARTFSSCSPAHA